MGWEREFRTRLLRIDSKLDELTQQVHQALGVILEIRPEMVKLELDDDEEKVDFGYRAGPCNELKLQSRVDAQEGLPGLPALPEEPREGKAISLVSAIQNGFIDSRPVFDSEAVGEDESATQEPDYFDEASVTPMADPELFGEDSPTPVPSGVPGLKHCNGPLSDGRLVSVPTFPLPQRPFQMGQGLQSHPMTNRPNGRQFLDGDVRPPAQLYEGPPEKLLMRSVQKSKTLTNHSSLSRSASQGTTLEERKDGTPNSPKGTAGYRSYSKGTLNRTISNFSRVGSKGEPWMRPVDRWETLVVKAFDLATSTRTMRQCWVDEDEDGVKAHKDTKKSDSKDQILDHYMASDKFGDARRTRSTRRTTSKWHDEKVSWMEWIEGTFIVAPYSHFRLGWVLLSLVFIMYDTTTLSMEVFSGLDGHFFGVMAWLSMSFWTIDIAISFVTGVFVEGELYMKFRVIAKSYVTTWLLFDLCLTAPLWIRTLSESRPLQRTSEDHGTSAGFMSGMRLVRLFRVLKVKPVLDMVVDAFDSIALVAVSRICTLICLVLGWMHLNGCMWFALGKLNGEDGWVMRNGVDERDPWYQYFASVQWAAAQLQGSTDVTIGYVVSERAYALFAILMSVVTLSIFISGFTNVLLMVQTALTTKMVRKRWLRDFFQRHKVPYNLSVRVRKHFEQVMQGDAKETEERDNEMLGILPTKLRREVLQETRSVHLVLNPVFDAMKFDHPRCFEKICCDAICPMWFMPDEHAFCHGELCTHVYVVLAGQLSYLRYSEIIRVLMDSAVAQKGFGQNEAPLSRFIESRLTSVAAGNWLCEAVLWMHWVHRGDVRSNNNTTLFALQVDNFELIVQNYPNVKLFGKKHAQRFIQAMSIQDNESDLFGSNDLLMKTVSRKQVPSIRQSIQLRRRTLIRNQQMLSERGLGT